MARRGMLARLVHTSARRLNALTRRRITPHTTTHSTDSKAEAKIEARTEPTDEPGRPLSAISLPEAKRLSEREPRQWIALTNSLTELSPEQARILAQTSHGLHLDGLMTIAPEAAKGLAQFDGSNLHLNGLVDLDTEVAECISRLGPSLHLNGLKSLSPDAASAFSRLRPRWQDLHLCGLERVTPETAYALTKCGRELYLNGLTDLDGDVAWEFMMRYYPLHLSGLAQLSDDAAEALGHCRADLYLDGIADLSATAAEALARHSGRLSLEGLEQLSEASARGLAAHEGVLMLNGRANLLEGAAQSMSAREGKLCLTGLRELPLALAETIARHWQCDLHFDDLTRLDEPSARALAGFRGRLTFEALKHLSEPAARALSQHKGFLRFEALTGMPAELAEALSAHEGSLWLDAVHTLTTEAARALSKVRGDLQLPSVTAISESTTTALAAHRGGRLGLTGLESLSGDMVKTFACRPGRTLMLGVPAMWMERPWAIEMLDKDALLLSKHIQLSRGETQMLSPEKYPGPNRFLMDARATEQPKADNTDELPSRDANGLPLDANELLDSLTGRSMEPSEFLEGTFQRLLAAASDGRQPFKARARIMRLARAALRIHCEWNSPRQREPGLITTAKAHAQAQAWFAGKPDGEELMRLLDGITNRDFFRGVWERYQQAPLEDGKTSSDKNG
jgi:hypothetical protein